MATLSRDTAIIYTAINIDGAGVAYRPYEALESFADVANRPIVVDAETNMGHGGAGGFVTTPVPVGEAAAQLALRILDGEDASKIPVTTGDFTGRFLTGGSYNGSESRWAAAGKRDPFSSPSVWEQYRWYIIAALAIILVQALDRWFALATARRRRAEAELRESQEFMELSTSAGELGLWARDLERGDLWTNVRLRSLFGFGQNDVLRFEDLLGRIHPEDRARVIAEVERQQQAGIALKGNFAW